MDGTQAPKRKGLSTIVGAMLSIVASAYIGGMIKSHLDRARPVLNLASVDFEGAALSSKRIRISPAIQHAYGNIPFKFDFEDVMTLEKFDDITASSDDHVVNLTEAKKTLSKVISILSSRASDYPKDKLRLELLSEWTLPSVNAMDTILRGVLDRHGYVQLLTVGEAYSKYRTHPDEWKNPATARVSLSAMRGYDLAEQAIKEDDDAGTVAAKLRSNVLRRLWIYLDRDLLLAILEHEETELSQLVKDMTAFVSLMKRERDGFDPARLHGTIVISNFGSRPAIFRNIGFLALKTGNSIIPVEAHIRFTDRFDGRGAFFVEGGKTLSLDIYSRETVDQISENRFAQQPSDVAAPIPGNGTLRTLYDSEVLECNVVLHQLTGKNRSTVLKGESKVTFGKSVNRGSVQLLEDAAKRISW